MNLSVKALYLLKTGYAFKLWLKKIHFITKCNVVWVGAKEAVSLSFLNFPVTVSCLEIVSREASISLYFYLSLLFSFSYPNNLKWENLVVDGFLFPSCLPCHWKYLVEPFEMNISSQHKYLLITPWASIRTLPWNSKMKNQLFLISCL